MNKTLIALYIVLAFLAGAVMAQHIERQHTREALKGTVKSICDYSRGIVSGGAEDACGIAQDINGLEYTCPSYKSLSIDCTVKEIK